MTPEHTLWQSVLLQALTDATYDGANDDLLREKRDADGWLRGFSRDFRRVCALAQIDPDFVRESYVAGRINPELLRAGTNKIGRKREIAYRRANK